MVQDNHHGSYSNDCQIASGAKNIKLGSVHPTRDFNFVEDTVEGFIASINSVDAMEK